MAKQIYVGIWEEEGDLVRNNSGGGEDGPGLFFCVGLKSVSLKHGAWSISIRISFDAC